MQVAKSVSLYKYFSRVYILSLIDCNKPPSNFVFRITLSNGKVFRCPPSKRIADFVFDVQKRYGSESIAELVVATSEGVYSVPYDREVREKVVEAVCRRKDLSESY